MITMNQILKTWSLIKPSFHIIYYHLETFQVADESRCTQKRARLVRLISKFINWLIIHKDYDLHCWWNLHLISTVQQSQKDCHSTEYLSVIEKAPDSYRVRREWFFPYWLSVSIVDEMNLFNCDEWVESTTTPLHLLLNSET